MSIDNLIKRLQNVMRQDAGVDGDAQRIGQIVWVLFLKVYDAKEEIWELHDDNYVSIIPEELRWRNWAVDNKDGEAMTGDELLEFINDKLFPALKSLEIDETTEKKSSIVKYVFEDAYNYMKNGVLLRQVINAIDEIDFTEYNERHAFNDIYETILKDLQSAGKSGEFYTPRVVTDFIAETLNPQIGEKVADYACGTGGFLTSALKVLEKQIKTPQDKETVQKNLFGIEKKALPHLLCITNLLLHDIDEPNILHGNSLERNVRDYKEEDRVDVIIMNPPYGGTEEEAIKINFPTEIQTSETADLFVALILYRLKKSGRVGIVLPDNFLFGTENSQKALKEKLLTECNLHTIVRLPAGVFAPYTSITTNVLFFDKTESTKEIYYYDIPLPKGYRSFSKTKPFKSEHLDGVREWWNNRNNSDINAYVVTADEIRQAGYNLDIKNPNKTNKEQEHTLVELLSNIDKKARNIKNLVGKITEALEGVEE
jgi:type I restriction enzyme M protein